MRMEGSIPACAGEPHPPGHQTNQPGVYPRVCGGTPRSVVEKSIREGLSPRVRGNRLVGGGNCLPERSIPACAGEPPSVHSVNTGNTVYPRVCGGTPQSRHYAASHCGLSPRVRGNPWCLYRCSVYAGSIPACAGEPPSGIGILTPSSVYPRVCGGTPGLLLPGTAAIGLSPRVRGNRHR